MKEQDLSKLKLENFLLQHSLSIVIRLLENGARSEDVVKIAKASLKIYPKLILELCIPSNDKREPEEIEEVKTTYKIRIITAIRAGIHRAGRIKHLLEPITKDDWDSVISEMVKDNAIKRVTTGTVVRYYMKSDNSNVSK